MFTILDHLRADVRSAFRGIAASPAIVACAVLTLAVAVGVNVAIFGLIDRALLSPPPHVVNPQAVFTLAFERAAPDGRPVRMTTTSYVAFESIRDQVPAIRSASAWQRSTLTATIDGDQVQLTGLLVSGSYFALLGAQPELGRVLTSDDDRMAGGAAPVVIGHALWTNTFGRDRQVLGRRLTLRGVECIVVGVMASGFHGHSAARTDVWMPIHAAMQSTPGWDRDAFRNIVSILLRVAPDQTVAAASSQAASALGGDGRIALDSIAGAPIAQTEQRIASWLAAVSVLVLLVGLANTATLLLVRNARRRREMAIRATLGATRARLVSEALIDAAMLATVAVGAALALASWFDEAIRRVLMPSLMEADGLGVRALGAAGLAGLVTFAVAASINVVRLPRHVRAEEIAAAGRGRAGTRAHAALLVVQTTMSVVLLAGAGLFGRSLYNLVAQDFGMDMDRVFLVEFELGPGGPQTDVFTAGLDRLRTIPGVQQLTPIAALPFSGFHVPPIAVPGRAEPPNVDGQLPYLIAATPELFEILGIRVVEGRALNAADEHGAPVVVVNEAMARGVWPGERAVGKCIRAGFDPSFDPLTADGPPGPPTSLPCREVVGVVRDVRQRSVLPSGSEARLMQYFVPFSQVPPPPGRVGLPANVRGLLVRAALGADVLAPQIRQVIVGSRTDLPFLRVAPYADLLERQLRPWRLGSMLLAIFSALALGVAAIGLYAAFSHAVGRRQRELAIRIALGALPRRVGLMVLGEAAVLAVVGSVLGCAISLVAGQAVQSMLFGTVLADPLVLGLAGSTMVGVALAATALPARRAALANPNTLLKIE